MFTMFKGKMYMVNLEIYIQWKYSSQVKAILCLSKIEDGGLVGIFFSSNSLKGASRNPLQIPQMNTELIQKPVHMFYANPEE